MTTLAQVNEFKTAQAGIVVLAQRELMQFWRSLNLDNLNRAVRQVELFMPELIQQYGEIGAAVAADFYAEAREDANISKAYSAVLGPAIPLEQVQKSTGWAVGPLFEKGKPLDMTVNNLTDITDRLVKNQGRDTVELNIRRDPVRVRYARVPSGGKSCTFCLMLASRGADYLTKESAERATKYHNKCNCTPTPIWDDSELPYDPDEYYDRWQDALEAEEAAKAAAKAAKNSA